jgi:hypothetical protein
MVLKFSGSSKHHQYKGTAGTRSSFRSGGGSYRRPYPGFIDDTSFTPAPSRVLGEDYYPRTVLAAGGAGGARTAASDTLDVTGRQAAGKSPSAGGSGWIPSTGEDVVAVEEAAPREWTAQVEPGVQITFGTIPTGGNDLKRIRFRCVLSLHFSLLFQCFPVRITVNMSEQTQKFTDSCARSTNSTLACVL